MKLLEVCVDSLASARAAKQGGADRLEFCSALAVGGLTPYADLLRQIKAELDLPVRCLMRPRAGDFLYTRDELELLCRQIETLRSAGADGFVIGALTPEGALDLPAMRTLLDACGGAPVNKKDKVAPGKVYAIDLPDPQPIEARPRAARGPARGAGVPCQLQNAAGKRYDLPPRGCPHGPARVGRMAYPADRRRRRARRQGRRNAVSAGRQNICPASPHSSKTKVPAVF